MKAGEFKIRRILARERGFTYPTYQVVGYLMGQRVRKRFKSLEEAAGEKSRLEIAAANADGGVRTVHIRLSTDQVAEAEACVRRLGVKSINILVEWFLENYRPRAQRNGSLRPSRSSSRHAPDKGRQSTGTTSSASSRRLAESSRTIAFTRSAPRKSCNILREAVGHQKPRITSAESSTRYSHTAQTTHGAGFCPTQLRQCPS
jgi:hypothetical protein